MQTLERLESQQTELIESYSYDDYLLWKSSPITKALLKQFEIDAEQLRESWAGLAWKEREDELRAQGQAFYLEGLEEVLKALVPTNEESINDQD